MKKSTLSALAGFALIATVQTAAAGSYRFVGQTMSDNPHTCILEIENVGANKVSVTLKEEYSLGGRNEVVRNTIPSMDESKLDEAMTSTINDNFMLEGEDGISDAGNVVKYTLRARIGSDKVPVWVSMNRDERIPQLYSGGLTSTVCNQFKKN